MKFNINNIGRLAQKNKMTNHYVHLRKIFYFDSHNWFTLQLIHVQHNMINFYRQILSSFLLLKIVLK